ncbi:hypothetical protein [Tomitella cavernea]|uniref:Uncharacterized protein n=1 Tax=Tomitella cavernea TaxID=1387982 RepID=A0ABP9CC48_9ACTN|nr:hypothetical protein [Tomitella cavernea]
MLLNERLDPLVRGAARVAVAGCAAAALAGTAVGVAAAAPGENLPEDCLQFSADGETWGGDEVIDWVPIVPVPGGVEKHAEFQVRNHCDTPGKVQVYAGKWEVTKGASAVLRADLDGVEGTTVTLGPANEGDYGILVGETSTLVTDDALDVALYVGIPADETVQDFDITPGWSLALEETAPVDGGDGGDGGADSATGSLGSLFGSLGIDGAFGSSSNSGTGIGFGSSDLLGSLGSLTGLDSPVVNVGSLAS